MAENSSDKPTKKKVPTALKRVKQDQERHTRNRSFKSRVRTAIRAFEKALTEKDKKQIETSLNTVYSLMDKGVKTGIYKKNKAARTKSRLTILEQKTA